MPPVTLSITLEALPPYYCKQSSRLGSAKILIGSLRNPANTHLRNVSDTLVKEWHIFKEEQQRSTSNEGRRGFKKLLFRIKGGETCPTWRVDSQEGWPLSIRDVIKSVEDAESHWRSKPRLAHGKAQSGFHRFCRTLDTHSNLLECLPSQNQYLSIFCGVTTTLIKVRLLPSSSFPKYGM